MSDVTKIGMNARKASIEIARLSTKEKNDILLKMAELLDKKRESVLQANKKDLENAKNTRKALLDRLMLNNERIDGMINSLKELTQLKDYIGEITEERTLKNGLKLIKKRVALGVVCVIYESRPNVTVDICGICLKSGSATILKGGKEAINSNKALIEILQQACPVKDGFHLLDADRKTMEELLNLREYIDLVIPRGGEGLISFVRDNSSIPVIETGTGNCHIYVDKEVEFQEAIEIVINAKTQRPGVCNAAEKLLVHEEIADKFLPLVLDKLKDKGVQVKGCEKTRKIIDCLETDEKDWYTEYLDLIIAIKIVDNVQEAIDHINKYGSRHSEAILGKDKQAIQQFLHSVDAAAVYSNASIRFTDGYEFGLGTEIGISTQKLHARGPMGLKAVTTEKYILIGQGQIRR